MDNIRFGAFVAQLRKEQGLTQKELQTGSMSQTRPCPNGRLERGFLM